MGLFIVYGFDRSATSPLDEGDIVIRHRGGAATTAYAAVRERMGMPPAKR